MRHIIFFVVIASLISACASNDIDVDVKESESHYQMGLEFAQLSLPKNALDEFDLAIKFNPNITNGDYIAVYEPINKIVVESTDVEYMVNDKQLKTYKLFKVQTVVHNVQNYTSIINCYSVDVNYSSIKQG